MVIGPRTKVVDVPLHPLVIVAQRSQIPVPFVQVPRNDDKGASPFGRIDKIRREGDVLRGNRRHHTVGMLCGTHIVYLFRIEPGNIVTVLDRAAHQVRYLQPAELLTVRAVGQHAGHIAAYRPVDERVNLVEQRIGTGKGSDLCRRIARMQPRNIDHLGQSPGIGFPGGNGPLYLDIAESVIGKLRMPRLGGTVAPGRIYMVERSARRTLVDRAVVVDQLSGNQFY